MRLDLDGPPHRNRTMRKFPARIYREAHGDKWAIPAPPDIYSNVRNLFTTLEAFMWHCNVTVPPNIQMSLF
jgi:hypothetical protein